MAVFVPALLGRLAATSLARLTDVTSQPNETFLLDLAVQVAYTP
ncbi:MAG TPA: hypothetical protein VGJ71_05170 [Candidatus Limnocylindrales bacterium]